MYKGIAVMEKQGVGIKEFFKEFIHFCFYIVATVTILGLVDIMLIGKVWRGVSYPTFENVYIIRIFVSAMLSLVLMLLYIRLNPIQKLNPLVSEEVPSEGFWPWVTLSRTPRVISIVLVIIFSTFFLFVFYKDPIQFRDISSDQKAVENFSVLFLFVATIMFVITAFLQRKSSDTNPNRYFYSFLSWLFAGVFFIILMEEVAWTQGFFFFDTPKFFINNSQGEMNIHNYATYHFELAYYFSTFLFFVILPFFYDRRKTLTKISVISDFLPSRHMVYIHAMAAAYNYDMWDNMLFQFCFFISIFILIYYAWFSRIDALEIILGILIIEVILTQVSFLWMGHTVPRRPAFKEYKEFFIPLTFMYYSFEIYIRSKKRIQIEVQRSDL